MQPLWTVPPIWLGLDAFILGGGPSLKKVNLEPLEKQHVIAVNNAYALGPWGFCFYSDCRWIDQHREPLKNFPGAVVTTCRRHVLDPGVKVLQSVGGRGRLSRDPRMLTWNLSSGAAAINLAYLLGVKKITLLGFDMRLVDGERNFHRDHHYLNRRYDPFPRFLSAFPNIADSLEDAGVEVVNACTGSALTIWPIVNPEDIGLGKPQEERLGHGINAPANGARVEI